MSDLSQFKSEFSLSHKLQRGLWNLCWLVLFRTSPRPFFAWRRFVARCFGATSGRGVRLYPSTRIFFPSNLQCGDYAVIGPDVDLYCVAPITIGPNAMISQYSFLCTGSHDDSDPTLPLIAQPITIGAKAWVCARAYIAPGKVVGEGAVVGACAVVTRDVEPWAVVAGNPAHKLRQRSCPS